MLRKLLLVSLLSMSACAATQPNQAIMTTTADHATLPIESAEHAARRARLSATRGEIEQLLQGEVASRKLPNLAFGLVFHGKLVYAVGLGARDASGGPVTEDTVFRIGSVTKTFTGLLLLELRDEGKLSLDDPAAKYLPELASIRYPTSDSGPVTLRHLVTHSSGIPRLGKLDYGDGHEVTRLELREAASHIVLDFAPGTRAVYSNLAVALLGPILARASGETFRAAVERRLFTPLGMTSTFWDRDAVPPSRLAQGYASADKGFVPVDKHWRMGSAEAMGGLYSTIADLGRYVAFQLDAWPPRDGAETGPVKRSTVRESQLIAGFARAGKEGYGVNWIVKNEPGLGYVVFHNGGTEGYHSSIWMLPDRSIGVIALGPSTGDLDGIARSALVRIAAADLSDAALTALDRVRELIREPRADLVDQAFTASFLEHLPREKMLAFFEGVKASFGTCTAVSVIAADSPTAVEVELTCEKKNAFVKLDAEPNGHHLMRGLLIRDRR